MHAKKQILPTRKTLYGIMLLAVFLFAFGDGNLPNARAQAWASTHAITYFQGNKAGAVSFTFDDGYVSQATTAVSELNARGLKGTFFLITDPGWISNNISWATWRNVAAQGHEIASHTVTHPYLSTLLSEDQIRWEFSTSQATINQNIPGQSGITIAYPFTDSNATVQAIVPDYYVAARGGWTDEGGTLNFYQAGMGPYGPFFPINFSNVSSAVMDGVGVDDPTFNSHLDRAVLYHAWQPLMYHQIPDATAFGDVIDYIQGKQVYWIDTFGNIARYMKERLNSTVQVITDTSLEIRLNIVMDASLPTSIYNVPLTLRSTVPASWVQVRVQQGSAIQTLTPVLEGGEKVVYYNAIPNGGDVVLTNPAIPTVVSISPASAFVGSAAFILTVTGTNFVNSSTIRWNNSDLTTTYISATQLTASIPASNISTIGTANVTVFNPIPGGGTSGQSPFSIIAKPITVTVIPNQSKVYGDAEPTFTYTSSDPAASFTGILKRISGENVGTYAINQGTLTVVGNNYVITSFVPANFTISAKPITVTVKSGQSKIYSSADPIFTYTSSDPAATFTGALNRTPGENVGSYAIGQGTLAVAGNNYSITSFVSANFTITVKPITVTVNPGQSKIYGDAEPIFAYTSSDSATTFTGALNRVPGENVGTYAIDQDSLAVAGSNYSIASFVPANFVINQKAASVSPDTTSKIFDSVDPSLSGSLVGFLPADGVTATYSRVAGENVAGSPYLISAILSPSSVLDNYNITYNTADFVITHASATVMLSNLNHLYDATQKSVVAETNPSGLPIDITYNGSSTAPAAAGSYTVVATVNDSNYAGISNNTLVIARVIVSPSITATNKTYDGTTGANIATRNLTGVIGTDAVSLSGGTATFADKNIGTGKSVTASGLALSGADAGNYQLSSTSTTTNADISLRTLAVTATGVNKAYDGTSSATVILSDDRVGGDDLTTNYTAASFLDPNAGSGKTVNVKGISITGGADSGNYVLGNTITTTTANITTASQTITVTRHAPVTASNSSTFKVSAIASSRLPIAITVSGVCVGGGDNTATVTMNSGNGICNVFYNQPGDNNYDLAAQVQENVIATQKPSITSADNTTFSLGLPGTFTITTTGNPSTPMSITENGALPNNVTFIDNSDGTATLSGIPDTAGIYSITITADNGVLPNATQRFKLTVKNGPTIGANGIDSVPGTGNGSITENEAILDTLGITQITVKFSQDVYDDPTDATNYAKDVTNPANYMLVRGSSTGNFQPDSCIGGVTEPDAVSISIDSVTYSNNNGAGPFIATLNINGGNPLNITGFYHLYVCGTTSIVDAANTGLKLAGDGIKPGTDFLRNFRIQSRVASGGNNNGNAISVLATRNLTIPVTGFAPNQVTPLPVQPADKAYKSLGELRIEIPTLGINFPIVGAAITKNGWDLTWLQNNVAYLEGSAYPTLEGNTVLMAHATDANNNLGPFSDIKGMQSGQKIYLHSNGQSYIYQVQENKKILPSDISTAFKHEEYSWITLVTCEDYNAKTGVYDYRRMVRATLVSVIPEK